SLHRAARPPDDLHPLGHGRERFLWAFLAAIASFLIGGCFSVAMAIRQLAHGAMTGSPTTAWVVLAVAFVADGISWLQSVRQARGEARERGRDVWYHVLRSSDPTVREVIVAAKVRPSLQLSSDELTRAMDNLDRALRNASPFVADVYIDVTSLGASAAAGEATPSWDSAGSVQRDDQLP